MKKYSSALAEVSEWAGKINLLKNQINDIEKIKGIYVISISAFLLKSQLVEFDIKHLLTNLDLHQYFSSNSKIIRISTRSPKYFDDNNYTLGALIKLLGLFRSPEIDDLVRDLKGLKKLRNQFTHKLFSIDLKLVDIEPQAKRGIKLANSILEQINGINKLIKDNDQLSK